MKIIIALDIGTSSIRAVLYDEHGAALFSAGREYHSAYPKPLHVEQNPLSWADSAAGVLCEAAAHLREKHWEAAGVAVTSQRSSLIALDAEGSPLRDAIMWQDKRNIAECEELAALAGMEYLYRRTGLRVNPLFVMTKLRWMKAHEPDLFARARRFVGVQDYVVHSLTGRFVTEWTQASRTMLMDLAAFAWDRELMELGGVDEEMLCELVPPGSVAGGLTAKAAKKTGLPVGLPVAVSGGDQQNAALALGVVKPGVAEANTGTGSFVLAYADKPVIHPECRVLCQAAAIPGKWVAEAGIFNTGAIYRWFKERFCPDIAGQENPYHIMNKEAMSAPTGSKGVIMLPHFEGSMAPNWNPAAKGVFFNLSLGADRSDMIRAIQEGIALEIRENLHLIQSMTGPISEISVAGGMTRSDFFCGVQASSYNKKVVRYADSEASALGACMAASPALGVHPTLEKAFAAMSRKECVTFEPTPKDVAVYDVLAAKRRKLYEALRDGGIYEEFLR